MRWSLTTIVFVLATGCGSSTTQTATAQATTTEASSTPAPPEPEVTEPAEPTCPSETTEWVYFPLFLRFGRESAELEEEHMEEAHQSLQEAAELLLNRMGPGGDVRRLRITGRSCQERDPEPLTRRRAEVLRDLLSEHGFPMDRLELQRGFSCEQCATCDIIASEIFFWYTAELQMLVAQSQPCP